MGWVPTLVIQSTSEIIFSSPTIPAIANLLRHIENYIDWHKGHIDCQSAKITTNQPTFIHSRSSSYTSPYSWHSVSLES